MTFVFFSERGFCTKYLACEAGVRIKPGAQAPGSNYKTNPEPAIAGDSARFLRLSPAVAGSALFIGTLTWGLRPRLYAYACYRRLRKIKHCRLRTSSIAG